MSTTIPVNFFKVTVLPDSPLPSSFYYVDNGEYAEAYLTDMSGVLRKIGNSQMIEELTLDINAGFF
jgi:hypothetical protein